MPKSIAYAALAVGESCALYIKHGRQGRSPQQEEAILHATTPSPFQQSVTGRFGRTAVAYASLPCEQGDKEVVDGVSNEVRGFADVKHAAHDGRLSEIIAASTGEKPEKTRPSPCETAVTKKAVGSNARTEKSLPERRRWW